MQLQKQDILFTARQLPPKRSRLPATVTQTNTMREDIYIGITKKEFKT